MIDSTTPAERQQEKVAGKSAVDRIFQFKEVDAPAGSPTPRCNTKAKLEAGKLAMQGVMLRLPMPLRKRIEEQTTGSLSVTICALAEYALDHLEKEGKAVIVTNR